MSKAGVLGFFLALLLAAGACGSDDGAAGPGDGGAGADGGGPGSDAAEASGDAGGIDDCEVETCASRGQACGQFVSCGEIIDCADEGITCEGGTTCIGGMDEPPECLAQGGDECDVCAAIPDCDESSPTRLSGRVLTPGRDDDDSANQVGVPNAVVSILSTSDASALPEMPSGLPEGERRCERCEDQTEYLGPFLTGTVTDATGRFEIVDDIPVGEEIVIVTMSGQFRRAETVTLPAEEACGEIQLPDSVGEGNEVVDSGNPTRLPRHMQDGDGANIPRTVVSTGRFDAMACVFEKMGIDHDEFANAGSETGRIQLYRGDDGAQGMRLDSDTPPDTELYEDLNALESYDMYVADCQGNAWDSDFSLRDEYGDHIREYVNRGGRLFASHLSFSWLHGNGFEEYDEADPIATGLAEAATFDESLISNPDQATGAVSFGREQESSRIDSFATWMEEEGVAEPEDYEFVIAEPRPQVEEVGEHVEEFVYCTDDLCEDDAQQFSFDTPYGAPQDDACGRLAYSAFHVLPPSNNFADAFFPDDCPGADLSDQEKVLLYMLFDLQACVGDPLPPVCEPASCAPADCGYQSDGCGGILDCGLCPIE